MPEQRYIGNEMSPADVGRMNAMMNKKDFPPIPSKDKRFSNEDEKLVTQAESILDYMKSEMKKWNGWNCLSISKPGSGSIVQRRVLEESIKRMEIHEEARWKVIDEQMVKWDKTLVPVFVHKEVPALQKSGLYEAITNRLIGWVKITNTEFGGLVCDRGYTFCVGCPFAPESDDIPTIEEEAKKISK